VPLTLPNPPAHARVSESRRGPRGKQTTASPQRRLPRYDAPPIIRLWHLASFDAPSVALVWSLAFAWSVRVRLPTWVLALQMLVVWAVYVGDRLLDARAGLRRWGNELRERHFYHWRHRRMLAPLAIAATCAAAAIVLRYMPTGTRERDSVLAAASLAYFTGVHTGSARRIFSKELLVGVLFTAGCALPAWSRGDWKLLAVPVIFFAALAWLNCRAIEAWESHSPARIARLAGWIALAGIALAGALAVHQPRSALLLAAGAASTLLLAVLDRLRARLTTVTLRAAADLVLLTPAFLVAAAWLVRG